MKENTKLLLLLLIIACVASCTPSGSFRQNGPALGGRLSAIVASPTDPNTLLVASPGGGIWKTTNNGSTWIMPNNYALADYTVLKLEWDKIRPTRLYASTQSDLYVSMNFGDTWVNLTGNGGYPDELMPDNQYADPNPFAQLKFSASTSVILWTKAGYGLYYSFNGSSFTQHVPFPGGDANPDNFISTIGVDEATGKVYFATMNFSDFEPIKLYRSSCAWSDGVPCLSWELANIGLPAQASVSSIIYAGSANLLALLMNNPSSTPYTKVFTTTDGMNWSPTTAMPSEAWDPRPMIQMIGALPGTLLLIHTCILIYVLFIQLRMVLQALTFGPLQMEVVLLVYTIT
jgi:hypothetical protein